MRNLQGISATGIYCSYFQSSVFLPQTGVVKDLTFDVKRPSFYYADIKLYAEFYHKLTHQVKGGTVALIHAIMSDQASIEMYTQFCYSYNLSLVQNNSPRRCISRPQRTTNTREGIQAN
jgi:hypothetical protein